MKNNFTFWEHYNKNTLNKILKLIKQKQYKNEKYIFADFHMHSHRSSDGKQTLEELLKNTKSKGLEIISITDHDNVEIYNDLYEFIQNNDMSKFPIIITGIEQTVSYPEYGEMCHILKHFINPKDKALLNDIKILEKSYFNRAKKQIKRIHQNPVLSNILKNNDIKISYESFLIYLKSKGIRIPDYAPLIDYLADEFENKNICYTQLFEALIEENKKDSCIERQKKKQNRFEIIKEKYKDKETQNNRRFLLSILAVRGVDDDIFNNHPSSGSLSVNEYGQPSIFNLNKNGITAFAHPTETAANTLLKCKNIGGKLYAVEKNIKNAYVNPSTFETVKNSMNLFELKGSDAHSLTEDVYKDMDFYKMKTTELENYINSFKELL